MNFFIAAHTEAAIESLVAVAIAQFEFGLREDARATLFETLATVRAHTFERERLVWKALGAAAAQMGDLTVLREVLALLLDRGWTSAMLECLALLTQHCGRGPLVCSEVAYHTTPVLALLMRDESVGKESVAAQLAALAELRASTGQNAEGVRLLRLARSRLKDDDADPFRCP